MTATTCCQTESWRLDGVREIPRCCWYQRPNAFGSRARKNGPPIPVTLSISVPPAIPSRTAAPAGGGETFGCVAVCSTMPSWFRPKMKLDPKANDRVRSSWRLRKSTHPPFEKSANRSTIPAQTGLWAVQDEVLGELSATRKQSPTYYL
jgi:hypothetical protein